MKPPWSFPVVLALLLLPAPGFAHSIKAPRTVRANVDGSFSYSVWFYPSSPVSLAELRTVMTSPATTSVRSAIYDMFCPSVLPGDSLDILILDDLWDASTPATVQCWVTLCGGGATSRDTTEIIPYSAAGVGDAAIAAIQLSIRPNPLRDRTTFHFTLRRAGPVVVHVFDTAGRRLATPVDGTWDAGAHSIDWNATAPGGTKLKPGVYLVRMDAAGQSVRERFVITR